MRASEKYNLLVNSPISYISGFFTSNFVENKGTTIGDFLLTLQTGKTPPKNNNKYWDSNDFCWYKPEEIGKDIYLYESDFKVSNLAVKEKKVTIFEENTILINCIGDIGRMGILKNKASSNQQITGLLFNTKVIPEYFFYYFLPKKDELISKSSSITLPIINQRKIQELEFNLIDIDKQKEFIRYMDYCLECYNNKIIPNLVNFNLPKELFSFSEKVFNIYYGENNLKLVLDKNISYIKQLKQAILQEAIEGKLTSSWRENNPNIESASILLEKIQKEKEELVKQKKLKKQTELKEISEDEIPFEIPENWSWCRLEFLSETSSGGTPNRGKLEYWENGKIPWLKSGELNDNKNINKSEEFINEIGLKNSSAKIFHKGTLLIALYGATAGKIGILGFDSTTNQAVCGISESKYIDTMYLFYFFLGNREQILYDSMGAAQPNISQFYIKNKPIPLPPLEEQKEIVKKVDEMMKFCDELEKQSLETKENSENLMKSVLSEVFSR